MKGTSGKAQPTRLHAPATMATATNSLQRAQPRKVWVWLCYWRNFLQSWRFDSITYVSKVSDEEGRPNRFWKAKWKSDPKPHDSHRIQPQDVSLIFMESSHDLARPIGLSKSTSCGQGRRVLPGMSRIQFMEIHPLWNGRLIHSATQVFLSKFCQCRDERQCTLLIFKLGKPALKTQPIYAKLSRGDLSSNSKEGLIAFQLF